MSKKKKNPAPPEGRAKPFNNPFAALGREIKAGIKQQQAEETRLQEAKAELKRHKAESEPDDGGLAFRDAMRGVERLELGNRVELKEPPPPKLVLEEDDDLEVMARLADLVSGAAEMDLRHHDQYVQGALNGVGDELMEQLRQGRFPLQNYQDLHGLGEADALAEAELFIKGCQARGLRHVLLVHGKGKGSFAKVPVIKNALVGSLTSKRMGKRVLAFCTALERDGGTGALYVLLRKPSDPGRGKWSLG